MKAKIEWQSVKEGYENHGLGFEELASKFECKPATICRRAREANWSRYRRIEKNKAIASLGERAIESRPKVLEDHQRLWAALRERLKNDTQDLETDRLKALKAYADVLSTITKIERLMWGLEEKNRDKQIDDSSEIAKAMAQVTFPYSSGEAVD